MGTLRVLLGLLLLTSSAWADGAKWEYDTTKGPIPETVTIKKGPSSTGPWTTVATIPALPATYTFPTPPDNQWYIVDSAGTPSNALNYYPLTVAYDDTALKAEIAAVKAYDAVQDATVLTLKGRVDALETGTPPVPSTSTITVKTLSSSRIEVSCVDGKRPTQKLDSSGLKRIVTCQ